MFTCPAIVLDMVSTNTGPCKCQANHPLATAPCQNPMSLPSALRSHAFGLIIAVFSVLTLAACAPEVGDECATSAECGTVGFCDTSSPGGYCTQTPCETNSCPDESVCVPFENDQTYCMRRCSNNGDCRSGYTCRDDIGPVKFCYIQSQ